jgi:hypothetical protein
MNVLLTQILFRLPRALPLNFSSLSFDYRRLAGEWCEAVFKQSSPVDRHARRQRAERLIDRSASLPSLVNELLPAGLFQERPDRWSVTEGRWQEWLDSLWGCDGDALCLLTCRPASAENLPVVWAPANAAEASHDAHVHLSALPPNALLWGTVMALGITAESGTGGLHSAFANDPTTPRLKEVCRLARVTLNTLRAVQTAPDADLPRDVLGIYADARNSIEAASSAELTYKFLAAFPRLQPAVFQDAIVCSDCFGVSTSMEMLREERRIVAQALAGCWDGRPDRKWLVDLLVLYWQCKGEWLRSIQGEPSETNSSLYTFRDHAKRAKSFTPSLRDPADRGLRRRFDQLLTSGFQSHVNARGSQLSLDLRIAIGGVNELQAASRWIESGLAGTDTRLFVGIKRRDDHFGRGDRDFDISENTIDGYFERLEAFDNLKSRVRGIDVFGFEATTCWSDYFPLMRCAAAHVERISGQCVLTFHCGEDPVCSLKGILDMWRTVNEFSENRVCRISHALALLNPHAHPADPIDHRIWNEMQLAANQLVRYAGRNKALRHRAAALERLWSEVEKTAVGRADGMAVPPKQMDDVIAQFRDAITEDLISRGVILEVCPTSNWRIGHVSSPQRHPIKYWHDRGGKWLIGTDDPCFIPCSVESEDANVRLSLQGV